MGHEQEQGRCRAEGDQEQGKSRARARQEQEDGQEQVWSRSFLFFANISPRISEWVDKKVERFCCRFWSVGLVGQKIAAAILNSFYVVFWPISDEKEMISQKKKNLTENQA